ncbi:MAG: carboxypeptidase-like regulatory domain-containing protein, partial [Thiovulaceae bacterium]|nr:carboxypeptidase-like regulatory domain-containing protein [Sulfurimonadaceae bacterium]
MKQTLIFLIALSFLWSSSADNDFTAKFENKSVYGLWLDLDSGKNIEINSKTNFSFERLDHDLIVIQKKGKKSYLKRIGALLTELSGRIVLSTSDKKYLPARNITLTVVNIKDPSIKAKIRTNNNGYFTNKSLPSGYYTILSST